MAKWAEKFSGALTDAGTIVDGFRDVLNPDTKDKQEVQAKAAWNWRPIAIALGGVVVVVVILKLVMRR